MKEIKITCDKCGVILPEKVENKFFKTTAKVRVKFEERECNAERIDLCGDCYDNLLKWLGEKK